MPSDQSFLPEFPFGTYRALARDEDHAWARYRWNIELTAALTPLACDVEITLRNTIHDQLTTRYGRDDWWASTDLVLDDIAADTLSTVVRKHKKQLAKGTSGQARSSQTVGWHLTGLRST